MRRLGVVVLIPVFVACSGNDREVTPSTTTVAHTSTTTTIAPTTTSTEELTPTTTTLAESSSQDPGTETIGVTDKVTIVIIDPED